MANYYFMPSDELYHHGIKGQKWGIRRYQNDDGSLTAAGKIRYNISEGARKIGLKIGRGVNKFQSSKTGKNIRKTKAYKSVEKDVKNEFLTKRSKDEEKQMAAARAKKAGKSLAGAILLRIGSHAIAGATVVGSTRLAINGKAGASVVLEKAGNISANALSIASTAYGVRAAVNAASAGHHYYKYKKG